MTIELNIAGMNCEHCVKAVENALRSVPGVLTVQVDLIRARATVTGNAPASALLSAVVEEGYGAEVREA